MSEGPITFFIPTLDPGGAERKTVVLANGFAARGREVEICTAFKADGILRAEVHPSVRVIEFGVVRPRYVIMPLRRYLRRARPRVLVCVMNHAAVFGMVANAVSRTRTPVVILEGGMNLTAFSRDSRKHYILLKTLIYLLYRHAARVIVNAPAIAAELIKHAHLSAGQIDVISNPAAVAVREDDALTDDVIAGWPVTDAPVVITVSRLDDNKDVATLLRAFALARGRRPLSLVIVGEGPERGALQALADTLGIASDTYFLERRPKPWRYVRRAALFVLSSRTEGFSNALVEAMAVGCPIVATAGPGGTALVLGDGRYGTLVEVGDYEAMAQAINRMLDNPTDSAQLMARAGVFAEGQVDAYLQVIERYAR